MLEGPTNLNQRLLESFRFVSTQKRDHRQVDHFRQATTTSAVPQRQLGTTAATKVDPKLAQKVEQFLSGSLGQT